MKERTEGWLSQVKWVIRNFFWRSDSPYVIIKIKPETLCSWKSCRQSIPIRYQSQFSQSQPWHQWPNAIDSQWPCQHWVIRYWLAEISSQCKKWQPIEAEDYLFDETDNTNFLLMVTFIYLMVTNVYPMVAEKSRLANPQKNENYYECDSYPQMSLFVRRNNNLKNTHFSVTW